MIIINGKEVSVNEVLTMDSKYLGYLGDKPRFYVSLARQNGHPTQGLKELVALANLGVDFHVKNN